MRSSTLVGHMGEITDIVGAILYLESASFVTSEILHVDGGQSVGLTLSPSHIAPYCFCFSTVFFWSPPGPEGDSLISRRNPSVAT